MYLPPEEFNDKILSPELSDHELRRLHGEVLHIYETYCLDESVDKISFDVFIVEEIRNSKSAFRVQGRSLEPEPPVTRCVRVSRCRSVRRRDEAADHALPV